MDDEIFVIYNSLTDEQKASVARIFREFETMVGNCKSTREIQKIVKYVMTKEQMLANKKLMKMTGQVNT